MHGSAIEIRLPAGRRLLEEAGVDPNPLRALQAVQETHVWPACRGCARSTASKVRASGCPPSGTFW